VIFGFAAACTGALYEVEVYVVGGNLVDLEAGVYHFSPAEFALRRLPEVPLGEMRRCGVLFVLRSPRCLGSHFLNKYLH
jgi:hypothetical protein